jgi:hypothetical protein
MGSFPVRLKYLRFLRFGLENGFVLQIFIVELVALQDQIPEFLDRKPILALSVSLRGRSWLGWQRAVFRR